MPALCSSGAAELRTAVHALFHLLCAACHRRCCRRIFAALDVLGYLYPWRDDDEVVDTFSLYRKAASLARLFHCRAPKYSVLRQFMANRTAREQRNGQRVDDIDKETAR